MIRPDCQAMLRLMRAIRSGGALPQALDPAVESLRTVVPTSALPGDGHPAYRALGDQGLRVDMAEKLIRAAHDGKGEAQSFAIDPALAISMGLSTTNAERLMRAAGFRREAAPAGAGADAATDRQRLWRWRGLARKKARGPAAGPENRGHFAALKEWKVAIG